VYRAAILGRRGKVWEKKKSPGGQANQKVDGNGRGENAGGSVMRTPLKKNGQHGGMETWLGSGGPLTGSREIVQKERLERPGRGWGRGARKRGGLETTASGRRFSLALHTYKGRQGKATLYPKTTES